MAESVQMEAQPRQGRGSHKAERLRRQGLVPAVVYGHKEATVPVAVSNEELHRAIRQGARVLDLKAGGKTEKVLIRELQWDHLGHEILHVDFARISADERIHVTVPIELRGTAPGTTAAAGGGVLDQPLHTLPIECLAVNIPPSIRVNIGELQVGQSIHVKDLQLPEGVQVLADPEAIVVHVKPPAAEPEPTAAVPAAEIAEPERIGRQKPAEEEEEGA
jgi:large subunit ribosomal protein L25